MEEKSEPTKHRDPAGFGRDPLDPVDPVPVLSVKKQPFTCHMTSAAAAVMKP